MSMIGEPVKPSEKLGKLLTEMNVPVLIGLEAQGHIPKIERMLSEGKGWVEIGKAIGWCPITAEDWYDAYCKRMSCGNCTHYRDMNAGFGCDTGKVGEVHCSAVRDTKPPT